MVRHLSERLMPSSFSFVRVLAIAGLSTLALAGCGRRGALEPPPNPTATAEQGQQQAGVEEDTPDPLIPSPVATPRPSNAKRGYTIPKEPFILDPLL